MKTQLGLYNTMELGGSVPKIEVNQDAVKKIRKSIAIDRINNDLNGRSQGFNEVSYDFKLCYHEKHPNRLFAIGQVRAYNSNSLIGHNFRVYAFDTEGNQIRFIQDSECIDGFFENCHIIQDNLC